MASGMNGQAFAFKGYLPRESKHRDTRWREMREGLQRRKETQIFMEPPTETTPPSRNVWTG